jgi:hypothetical protein
MLPQSPRRIHCRPHVCFGPSSINRLQHITEPHPPLFYMSLIKMAAPSLPPLTQHHHCPIEPPYHPPPPPPAICDYYDSSGSTWPALAFPAAVFLRRYSAADLTSARRAWNTFERVEAHDAAVRVRLGPTGWTPSSSPVQTPCTWYLFASNEERLQYIRGKALHDELCPNYAWIPQRNIGITPPPVNVYPTKIF